MSDFRDILALLAAVAIGVFLMVSAAVIPFALAMKWVLA